MADIKFYDAHGNELHIGDAVQAIPDVEEKYWVHGLEYGIVTELYDNLADIDMQAFWGSVYYEKYGTHVADCKYVIKIDERGGDVIPSSSLLDCLNCI